MTTLQDQFDKSIREVAEKAALNELEIQQFQTDLAKDIEVLFQTTSGSASVVATNLINEWMSLPARVGHGAGPDPTAKVARPDVLVFLQSAKTAAWPAIQKHATLQQSRVTRR